MSKCINLDQHEALAAAERRLLVILRPVRFQPNREINGEPYWYIGGYRARPWTHPTDDFQPRRPLRCPYGSPGDVVVGREKWHECPHCIAELPVFFVGNSRQLSPKCAAHGWLSSATMPAAIARHRWTLESVELVKCSELHPRLLRDGIDDELARDWWNRRWPKCQWETSWAWKLGFCDGR